MALGGRPRYIVPATLDLCDFLELQAKFGKVDLQVEFTVSERLHHLPHLRKTFGLDAPSGPISPGLMTGSGSVGVTLKAPRVQKIQS